MKKITPDLRILAEVDSNSIFPFVGKSEGKSLHANSLSRAITQL